MKKQMNDRKGAYVRVDASAETTDNASDNELGQSKRCELEDSADDDERTAYEDSSTTSKDLAIPHGGKGAHKTTQIIGGY